MLAALISNIVRDKNDKIKTVADFMPADIEPFDPTAQSWENLRQLAETPNGKR